MINKMLRYTVYHALKTIKLCALLSPSTLGVVWPDFNDDDDDDDVNDDQTTFIATITTIVSISVQYMYVRPYRSCN